MIRTISGVFRDEAGSSGDGLVSEVLAATEEFEQLAGRRPRILVAKMGQDGHDRGQKVVVSAFADMGFDVDVGPLFSTPEEVAQQAVDNDVHLVGVSSLAAGHLTLVPALKAALAEHGRPDIMVVVGGVIPPDDVPTLKEMGAAAVFLPGTVIAESALDLWASCGPSWMPEVHVGRSSRECSPAAARPSRRRSRWSSPAEPSTGPRLVTCSPGWRRPRTGPRRPGRHLGRARRREVHVHRGARHPADRRGHRVGVLAVDPSSTRTGGSVLGDKTRMG